MILELKQCNDSKKFELITPESSTYYRILSPSFHSFCHSIPPSITLLLHTPYSLILSSFSLTAIRPVSVSAHNSFPPIYIKLPKATILYSRLLISQPSSLSAWPLVCYRSVHTPLFTRVQL